MVAIVSCTATGEEHGLVNTLTNSVVFDDFKNMTPTHKAQCEKQKKEDSRMVKVKYINIKGNHERLTKPYCRYAGDPILQYNLIPGHVYELPMGFINEVNQMKKKKRSGLVEVDGNKMKTDGSPLDKDTEESSEHMLVSVNF
jgi:hypothetical protein